ncbi:BLUF domain-containing protein [Spirosoma flavum]|uniref:BLUF domain-containing protein n=1 Tax=Spirosoma flavum TaxID=2048557 RepID=A0ABW6ACQ9_9BACT
MDHCIVYLSSAVEPLEKADLSILLLQSRRDNIAANITGVLLYAHGSIIQALEGNKAVVEGLYKRIEKDYRHKNVTLVLSRPITQRLFSSWAMGYETMTTHQLDEITTLMSLVKQKKSISEATSDHIVLKLIRNFFKDTSYLMFHNS